MSDILYAAHQFDLNAEPKDPIEMKCSHDLCTRNRVGNSKFCDKCIQLSTTECNYCKKE
jgi:hypothetical protein